MTKSNFFLFLWAASIPSNVVLGSRYQAVEPSKYYKHPMILVSEKQEKVNVQVYYECLCPACIYFHKGPLIDVISKIGSYINYKSYPYGNAKKSDVNGTTEIVCQHGPLECYGNKLHACAIDIIKNETRSEFYNSCMMSAKWGGKGSTDMDAIECGKSMGIDGTAVTNCARNQRGEELLEYYGKETEKHNDKKFVPYVLINGKLFDGDFAQFLDAVCKAFTNQPSQCQKKKP